MRLEKKRKWASGARAASQDKCLQIPATGLKIDAVPAYPGPGHNRAFRSALRKLSKTYPCCTLETTSQNRRGVAALASAIIVDVYDDVVVFVTAALS